MRTGEEGTGLVLDPAGLGESPSVARVRRRCGRLIVGVCRPGCSGEAEDSCVESGSRRRIVGAAVMRIGCRAEVGLVFGMEDSAGRNSGFVAHAVREDKIGSAGCMLVWKLGSWCRSLMEDRGRTG